MDHMVLGGLSGELPRVITHPVGWLLLPLPAYVTLIPLMVGTHYWAEQWSPRPVYGRHVPIRAGHCELVPPWGFEPRHPPPDRGLPPPQWHIMQTLRVSSTTAPPTP